MLLTYYFTRILYCWDTFQTRYLVYQLLHTFVCLLCRDHIIGCGMCLHELPYSVTTLAASAASIRPLRLHSLLRSFGSSKVVVIWGLR